MGSPSGEEGRYGDEGPLHRVRIAEPFAVGVHEVTFAEWDACRRGGGCTRHANDRGWGRGNRPVISVSWEDAKSYVRWLSLETGERYRLLSESEWEYVARAGTRTRYHWGDGIGRGRANCDGCGSRWDDERTAPVGSFSPNGFGLHDVHGNAREWVEDCWHGNYSGAPMDGRAWTSGGNCGSRVLRGGSWFDDPRYVRSALRVLGRPREPAQLCRFSRCQDTELNPESLPRGLLCGGPGGSRPLADSRFHWDFSASECRASGPSRARAVCARWRCGVATAPGPRRRPLGSSMTAAVGHPGRVKPG